MKKIAVLTSGGDAPGMNAAIRAVVRGGLDAGLEVCGVRNGYAGLMSGDFLALTARAVGGLMERGGTFLGSARSAEFRTEDGVRKAIRSLNMADIEGLVVIGGNGSQSGALALSQAGFPVVGVASTIDNDLCGSDITIGVDSALNMALEAIDRLKVTATSHTRAFLVEVMGRDYGYLALMAGIAGGAEAVLLPEVETQPEVLAADVRAVYERGKPHAIIVVAEGAKIEDKKGAQALVDYFEAHRERMGFDVRTITLGHVQRGATPTAADRLLATRLGVAAAQHLAAGKHGDLMGIINNAVVATPLAEIVGKDKPIDPQMLKMANVLAR